MSKTVDDPIIISVPSALKKKEAIKLAVASKDNDYATMYDFNIPFLGECSLEQLMHMNDEMARMDGITKTMIEKICKTYHDMSMEGNDQALLVEDKTMKHYLDDFHWNEARFPQTNGLGEHKNMIAQESKRMENDMKKMIQKYQDIHINLTALKRKKGMNILSASMNSLLTDEEIMKYNKGLQMKDIFVETEYLTTLLVILNTSQVKEFKQVYVTLGEKEKQCRVLPDSCRLLHKNTEGYEVYSIIILKRFLNEVQQACREYRYIYRMMENQQEVENGVVVDDETQIATLEAEEKKVKSDILQWCRPNYSELAMMWVHLKALRVVVESLLRYGLHTQTYIFILFPKQKYLKRMYDALAVLFEDLEGDVKAYGSLNDDNMLISAVAGSESTNYTYACVGVERIAA